MITEFGQKCLEAASTLKYESLNSCITVHSIWIMKILFNVMLLNTCSCYKRRKNCEESRWRSQRALVQPSPIPCLILALATNIRTYKDTKPQRYKRFFQNCSKKEEKTKFWGWLVQSVVFQKTVIKSTFNYWIEAEYEYLIVHFMNGLLNQQTKSFVH